MSTTSIMQLARPALLVQAGSAQVMSLEAGAVAAAAAAAEAARQHAAHVHLRMAGSLEAAAAVAPVLVVGAHLEVPTSHPAGHIGQHPHASKPQTGVREWTGLHLKHARNRFHTGTTPCSQHETNDVCEGLSPTTASDNIHTFCLMLANPLHCCSQLAGHMPQCTAAAGVCGALLTPPYTGGGGPPAAGEAP